MRKKTALTLGELESKLSGYVALLQFRYSNLCVEADPVSLLPITVEYDGDTFDIEEVADVAIPQKDQLQVYPKDPLLLLSIGKAVAEYHPEFKQKIVDDEEENKNGSSSQDKQENEDENKSLLLTMPVVNKDRRDFLKDGVKLLYDELKVTLTTNLEYYTKRVVAELAGASAEEIDEAKEGIEDIKKQHFDLADTYRERKEKEIEEAYKLHTEKKTKKAKKKKEHEVATNMQAGQSFKMPEMPEAPKMPE